MNKKYELLAPAGDFRTLHSALSAGADAIYFGVKGFNMRDTAKNFKLSEIPKIRKVCDSYNKKVKIYLALNTIVFDDEIEKIEKIVRFVKGSVDAIICWDFSVIELCKKYKIPFHISTQASVANTKAALFYKKIGASRIILARELNLKQIKKISKVIEVECFAHGAMCVAISGRCFMSQFIHNLSANKGRCAHPCRRAYKIIDEDGNELLLENSRVLSAKDLCTLPFIEKMKKAGISSFKIEGRNRNPEYVYNVVLEYRKALDRKLTKKEIEESLENLKKVYNRGFSSGFYLKMPTSDDFSSSENGEQKESKEFIGRVEKYWPKAGAASVKIFNGVLKLGDEVYLLNDFEPLKRVKIESIEINGKKVNLAKKGQEVGISLPYCKRGTEIYLIKKQADL